MRRVIMVIISLMMLASCRKSTEEDLSKKFQEKIDNISNYSCIATIIVNSNEKSSTYVVEEMFIKPDKFNIKIIEPKESEGCTITYEGNKVFLEHPMIEQSLSITDIKTLNKNIFIGEFFESIKTAQQYTVEVESIEDEEYLIFKLELLEKNKYRKNQKVWIKKKDFVPYKTNILDGDDNVSLEIYYQDFNYDVSTKKN